MAALASGIGSGVAVVDLISFPWGLISNSSLMFHSVYKYGAFSRCIIPIGSFFVLSKVMWSVACGDFSAGLE